MLPWTLVVLCVFQLKKTCSSKVQFKEKKNDTKWNSNVRDPRHKTIESRIVESSSPWTLIAFHVRLIGKNLHQQCAKQKNWKNETKLDSKVRDLRHCQQSPKILNSLVLHHLCNLNIRLSYQYRSNGAIDGTKHSDLNTHKKKKTKL